MENEKEILKPEPVPETPMPKSAVVKTYAEDMADAIDHVEGGMIRQIIQEQEDGQKREENVSPESTKNKTLMLISAILIVSAFVSLFLVITFKEKAQTVEPVKQTKNIIFVEQNKFLEVAGLSKTQIIETIKNEVSNSQLKIGGIEAIYLTENKNVVTFKRFMELIQSNVPAEVTEYTNDNFMIGIYNNEDKSLFILLNIKSFADIFPGMKAWENKIWSDLHDLFDMELNADTKYLLTKSFEDNIIENKNSRALYDNEKNKILEYVFVDETSVVIISNDDAVHEVMSRLYSAQLAK
ncbi:MAG: hypothetical protein V4504_01430 [Patescibacteria group bacterium]